MKIFKTFCALACAVWIITAVRVTFFDYDLPKIDSVFTSVMTALLFLMFAVAKYSIGGDNE
jgi:hypothetical protein